MERGASFQPVFSDDCSGHIVVIHRWQDRYAHYTNYFDHSSRPVTYITTAVGRVSVPDAAAGVVVLPRTSDLDLTRKAVAELGGRFGQPQAIIALKEGDLPVASRLREELDIAGRRPADLHHFLDKFAMAQAVTGLGLEMPEFEMAPDPQAVRRFAARVGWPVVIKPLRGSASQGVLKVSAPDCLRAVEFSPQRPLMVERFLPYPIVHVDGLSGPGGIRPWRASEYICPPLGFNTGAPMGSFEIDDPSTLAVIEEYITRLIPGLSPDPYVFHLEMFLVRDSVGPPRCVFMEIGCRVGGADVPWLWREVHGMDLMHAECAMQAGRIPELPDLRADEPVAGYVVLPLPVKAPCRVLHSTSMVGPGGPYAETVPAVGTVIPAADAVYEHVGGRFRFSGATSPEVEAAVRRTADRFEIRCEPLFTTQA
ncbi:MAG TPA: hypothetical protein VGG25_13875 [Streptosporangiaceae bacterium]|jgi:hypothetical protein